MKSDYLLLEAANVYLLLVWTVAILPPNTDVFNGGVYLLVSKIATEAQFGGLFLFLFLNSMAALVQGNLWYRLVFSLAQAVLYLCLVFLFILANPNSVISLLVGGWSVFSFIVAARLARDIYFKNPSWTL